MASAQDRNKLKRVSYDTWSTREQLCLATSVLKSGDQNWIGVSRSLKPFAEKEALRPPDWFSQKSCAMQYAILLENADAPKRKKRESGETTGESIVRRLTQERIAELGQILAFQRDEYQQLKAEVNLLRSGTITEEKLQKMWLAIEQEERDQEQKSRAHAAWLAKRQQKQEIQSLPTVTLAAPRKNLEAPSESQETGDSTNDEEEKKNRGGRSPLLTSLLKSPSPTIQTQTPTSNVTQVNSPTIASLLSSSPKVPNTQITVSVSQPQLHQLVSTVMTNTTVSERPSVGAPTLSMLLELPANLQRNALANLQQATSNVQQQTAQSEIHAQSHNVLQTTTQNDTPSIKPTTIAAPSSVPATESMVQIIEQIDDVIRKDIMTDPINKDEINEIIGDLEELIKEEITASPTTSPQTSLKPAEPVNVVENLPIPEVENIVAIERPEPRDVDEPVSLSNSPQSEMAIEEIDRSTSSIAEIIGTVATEPEEPKIIAAPVAIVTEEPTKVEDKTEEKEKEKEEKEQEEEDINGNVEDEGDESEVVEEDKKEEIKPVAKIEEKSPDQELTEARPRTPEKEDIVEETSTTIEKETTEEKKIHEEPEETKEVIAIPEIETKSPEPVAEKSPENPIVKECDEAETAEVSSEVDESIENSNEPEESPEESTEKNDTELDQIELDLAKITGEQNEAGSAEIVSVCSEITTDVPSIEDNEKSQDISMILEDDESSQSSSCKKKDADEHSNSENAIECSDSQEFFKEDSTSKDATTETTKEPSPGKETSKDEVTVEKPDDQPKIVDSKDSEDSMSATQPEIEKGEKIEETVLPEPEKKIETDEKLESKTSVLPSISIEDDEKREFDESPKSNVEEVEEKKPETPVTKEEKPEVKEEERDLLIEQLEEPKKEETEVKEEKEDEIKPTDGELPIKKEKEPVESAGSVCDDMGDLDEEESSLSKLSGGRAMKTYSKKQTIAVDSETENESSGENADYRAWKKAVMLVYNRLATHKYASAFLRPITEDQAPGYHSVIFRPMDLSTIKKNIENGTIRSTIHFQRDVMLMFQNAIMYNKQDTFVYKMAISMQEECLQHMQLLVHVRGEGQLRRETRTAASSSSETSDSSIKRKRSHITPSPHDTDSPRGKKRRKSEND